MYCQPDTVTQIMLLGSLILLLFRKGPCGLVDEMRGHTSDNILSKRESVRLTLYALFFQNIKVHYWQVLIVIILWLSKYFHAFWDSYPKESTCNVGELGSIPGLGRSPGGWQGNSLQYSCLRIPMDRGA